MNGQPGHQPAIARMLGVSGKDIAKHVLVVAVRNAWTERKSVENAATQ